MTYRPHGRHLIAGEWVGSEDTFASDPASGPSYAFSLGTVDLVDAACAAAEAAFEVYSATTREVRAQFLEAIAAEIELRGAAITEIGHQETGLPPARLEGERGRTTGQLRLFAAHIRQGDYLDRRRDLALPDRQPLPRPEIRLMQRPIGPVAVFGASNFPLAFSTAGGDTASALAAAQPADYPSKPIRLVVPYAPGGIADLLGRVVAQPLGTLYGRALVVENRSGSGGHDATNRRG